MSKALSLDLRSRVLAAIEKGMSCRQVALRFGVSASSAIRWRALERIQGDAKPKALGGDRRSGRIEVHAPQAIRRALDAFTQSDCQNYFVDPAAGFGAQIRRFASRFA